MTLFETPKPFVTGANVKAKVPVGSTSFPSFHQALIKNDNKDFMLVLGELFYFKAISKTTLQLYHKHTNYNKKAFNFYLFGVLRRFQHCTGHIAMISSKDRGNQYIQLVNVLYCKLPTNGKQLPAFPLEVEP